MYKLNGVDIACDDEGYVLDLNAWSPELMYLIAQKENLNLNDDHICVVNMVRQYYQEYSTTPAMRTLIAYLKKQNMIHLCSSVALARLFPNGAAKTAAKLAGLPKPVKCI